MFTLTYIIPAPGTHQLVTVCTPSRSAAYLTWAALRAGRFAIKPRLWHAGRIVAG